MGRDSVLPPVHEWGINLAIGPAFSLIQEESRRERVFCVQDDGDNQMQSLEFPPFLFFLVRRTSH